MYEKLGWRMASSIERVYDNARARSELGWEPRHDFAAALERLASGSALASPLVQAVGIKGYHGDAHRDGLYPVAPAQSRA